MTSALMRPSFTSRPKAPALPTTDPPTVPGTPEAKPQPGGCQLDRQSRKLVGREERVGRRPDHEIGHALGRETGNQLGKRRVGVERQGVAGTAPHSIPTMRAERLLPAPTP